MGGLAYLVQETLRFEEAGEEGAGAEDLPVGELGGGHRLPHPAYGPGQDLEGPLAEAVVLQAEGAPEEVGVEAHASRVPELLGQDLHPLAAAAPSGWEASPFTAFTAAWGTLCPGAERAGGRCKQLKNSPQIRTIFLFHPQSIQEYRTSQRAAKEAKGGKMNPRMPKGEAPKLYLGVHARLVFLKEEDEAAVLDLMRRFSSATRFAYNRLLEGRDRKELKREDGPLCTLFGLNTRYADGAIEKAQATLDSAKELGQDPRKVVFGGESSLSN
jgi:predicted transposase